MKPNDSLLQARLRPKKRLVLSMHPFQKIDSDAEGLGGGIRLRVYGEGHEPTFLEVIWGETTEIEVIVD